MRKAFVLAIPLVAFELAYAHAATVDPLNGSVQVNSGSGFLPILGQVTVKPGDKIKTGGDGTAVVVYSDSCSVTVDISSNYTIAQGIPCGAVGSTTGVDPFVVAAGAVGGAVTVVVVAKNHKAPASP